MDASLDAQTTYPVRVTNLRFLYGVGRGPTSPGVDNQADYYRGYGLPGTLAEITAEMQVGGLWRPIYGDVAFTITFTGALGSGTFTVPVKSGQNVGLAPIPYDAISGFSAALLASNATTAFTYAVTAVSGTYVSGLNAGSPTVIIYWNRASPPSSTTLVTAATTITASSIQLFWAPLDTTSPASLKKDFYEYRVLYRTAGSASWKTWNGVNDPTMRGMSNNIVPVGGTDAARHFLNGNKYTTISNLRIFTQYEYVLIAVDIFGNESPQGTPISFRTKPYSVTTTITDGITTFKDFIDLTNPQLRTLRPANIRIDIYIVSSDTTPDRVTVWYANHTPHINFVDTATNTINAAAFGPNTLYSVDAKRLGPNQWAAYLSTQSTVIVNNNAVRYIVESSSKNVSTFISTDATGNPNVSEWNFYVGTPTRFDPQPVRILNNVITGANPYAYPSYYLTDDATVTIKVYDVRGRLITTLLDNGFRRGGQNIKEQGWGGDNKSRRKLGVGLYYIHIQAKRTSDGKVILNNISKVVMAK